jgi:hypothetical protein
MSKKEKAAEMAKALEAIKNCGADLGFPSTKYSMQPEDVGKFIARVRSMPESPS